MESFFYPSSAPHPGPYNHLTQSHAVSQLQVTNLKQTTTWYHLTQSHAVSQLQVTNLKQTTTWYHLTQSHAVSQLQATNLKQTTTLYHLTKSHAVSQLQATNLKQTTIFTRKANKGLGTGILHLSARRQQFLLTSIVRVGWPLLLVLTEQCFRLIEAEHWLCYRTAV